MQVGRRFRAVTAAVLGIGALGACGGGGGGADLEIYSGRNRDLIEPLIERFEAASGLDVTVRYPGDSAVTAQLIVDEGDRAPDVFISQSPGAMGWLDSEDLLSDLDAELLARVPETYRSPNGHWVGTSARVRVLVYNSNEVAPAELPGSIFDLTDPIYEGRVGLATSNPSFIDFVSALRELEGDDASRDLLAALADNGARDYGSSNDAVLAAVARGEVDFGLINHYYNARAKAEDPEQPTENHLFDVGDPGSVVLLTTIGLLATGDDHRDAATQFIEFVLSDESQRYFADETLEYAIVEGIESGGDSTLPPLAEIDAPVVDLARLGADFAATQQLIDDSGLVDS
jgi:iron(III) transport system substrate-binding protein